jgi:diguanylate cyclase (GGDEF)-like protein
MSSHQNTTADPVDATSAIARFGDLPTLAPVAFEVLRLADDDRATLDDIGRVISRDPGLSGQMLRVANSAMYGMGGEVTSLGRAAAVLGLRTVKLLSLSFSVVTRPEESDATGQRLWRHTLIKAALSRMLATAYQPRLADECFIAGLLGNMGKLVLETEPRYVALRGDAPWLDGAEELAMLGVTSDDVAAQVLEGWGLPELLADAIRHTDDPHALEGPAGAIARILQVADAAARFLTASEAEGPDALAAVKLSARTQLQLEEDDVDDFLTGAADAVDEIATMFKTDALTHMPVSELLTRAKGELARMSLDMVAALSAQETRSEELAHENERLATEALTDPLTQLPNRRSFEQTLSRVINARLRRPEPTSLGLLMMDLDHFKMVNDTHGHQAGDDVLRGFATRLSLHTRRDEYVARVGGEEFVIVIPVTDADEIQLAAERFRRCVASSPFDTCAGPLDVTVSIGVASTTDVDENTATTLYEAADQALYVAKDSGRNRFAAAPPR